MLHTTSTTLLAWLVVLLLTIGILFLFGRGKSKTLSLFALCAAIGICLYIMYSPALFSVLHRFGYGKQTTMQPRFVRMMGYIALIITLFILLWTYVHIMLSLMQGMVKGFLCMTLNLVLALLAFMVCVRFLLRRHSIRSWRTWLLIALFGLAIAYGYLFFS